MNLLRALFRLLIYLSLVFGGLSAQAKPVILITYSFSGSLSVTSELTKAGTQLSFKNNESVLEEYKVVYLDIGDDVKLVFQRTKEAIRKYKPIVILGAITSNRAMVISKLAEDSRIPFITPLATNPLVTKGRKYVFRLCYDDERQASLLAKFAHEVLGKKQVLVLANSKEVYSMGLAELFKSKLGDFAVEVDVVRYVEPAEIKNSLASKKYDLVFIPSYQKEAAKIIVELSKVVKDVAYLGPDSWGGAGHFSKILNSESISIEAYYSYFWSPESTSKNNQEFLRLINEGAGDTKKKFGLFEETSVNAALAIGYDSGEILVQALRKLNSKTANFLDVLKTTEFKTHSGNHRFNKDHSFDRPMHIFKIGNREEKHYKVIR